MKLSPLTDLIIDLKVKHMTKRQIEKNIAEGKYKGASPDHVKGYVDLFFGSAK